MTDQVQKIREEVEKLKSNLIYGACSSQIAMETRCKEEAYNEILAILDFMQEEPVKIKKGCKYRSICNVTNNDTGNISFVAGKIYLAPKDNTLVSEENGWLCDTSENSSNFELVEEPVSFWHDASEKPERDDLLIETNDGRIIHRQSINNYGMVKRWAYASDLLNLDNSCNFGKNLQEEPVSEDLKVAAIMHQRDVMEYEAKTGLKPANMTSFKAGARWQKQQLMKKAIEGIVTTNIDGWINVMTGFIRPEEAGANFGNKVKVIIIKEEGV